MTNKTIRPLNVRDVSAAYYRDLKTTFDKQDPLYENIEQIKADFPYFIAARDGQDPRRTDVMTRIYTFAGKLTAEHSAFVTKLAEKEGLCVNVLRNMGTEGDILELRGFHHVIREDDFKDFAKGLGIMLRAATQHKREQAFPQPGVLEDYFL
ncbi:MAG: hypothetical protein LRZ85_04520 [Alphaproteobacteria bacterium]|nr:hypothetical protein [Alphaproteobacteria bacterium]MCD8571468.1 hypothetical protein [Alphaproteobacteria bacterium]